MNGDLETFMPLQFKRKKGKLRRSRFFGQSAKLRLTG